MASLPEIKQQIGGVKNTRKITKAMQLVAASKSTKFQKKVITIRDFAFDLLYILHNNISSMEGNSFVEERKEGDILFVLYSSDKGLCGALNQQLFRTLFQSDVWKNTSANKRKVIVVGKKAKNFIEFNGFTPIEIFEGVDESLTSYDALDYVKSIVKHWDKGGIQKVYMVSPHYKNAFTFYPLVKQFLPLSDKILKAHLGVDPESFNRDVENKKKAGFMIYEPSEKEVQVKILEQLTEVLFLQAFYELKASEYSSRMMAMQSATDNATEIINDKTLELNKARQSAITQEISEIVGASFV